MRILYSLIFILFVSQLCYPQSPGFRYGFHFGAGQATIKGVENQLGKLAIHGGIISSYQINKNFGLVSELLLSSKGSRASGSVKSCCLDYKYEEVYKLYYAEVPVMAKGSIGIGNFHFKLFSGPSFNFNLKSTRTRTFEDVDYNMIYGFVNSKLTGIKLMEFSWVAGAGLEVELAKKEIIFLDIRNNTALNSFGFINNKAVRNNYFAVGVGYLY